MLTGAVCQTRERSWKQCGSGSPETVFRGDSYSQRQSTIQQVVFA